MSLFPDLEIYGLPYGHGRNGVASTRTVARCRVVVLVIFEVSICCVFCCGDGSWVQ